MACASSQAPIEPPTTATSMAGTQRDSGLATMASATVNTLTINAAGLISCQRARTACTVDSTD